MSERPRKACNQPAWLQFTSIENGIVPHHVPYPLVRRLDQIFTWAAAEALEGEETETPRNTRPSRSSTTSLASTNAGSRP